jgi:carboxyl-terminal processing protease
MRLAVLLLTTVTCYAQTPAAKSAMDAYEYVQARRAEAEKLWSKGDAAGLVILENALKYLDQPLVRDLAAGDFYLASRRSDVFSDYAEAYAIQGNVAESLRYLNLFASLDPSPGMLKFIERQKHFDVVRADPGYKAYAERQRQFERFWDSPTLNTAFRENIPDAEKLAGLSKFWSEVKYNFGYPEKLIALDWDKLYLDAIPTVLATKSTRDYYRELRRLCARLGDGHTNVYPPSQLDDSAKPPLRTALVEGRVLVVDARSPSLEALGINAGVEVLAVDGVPVLEYARLEIEPFQSASTPQDRETRTFWYGFLRGPSTRPVHLKLRDPAGKEFEREVSRRNYTDVRRILPFEWRLLAGNIAYVALNDFSVNDVVRQWNEAYPQIAAAAAIVLDLRSNGGGSTNIGYEVIRSIVDRPFAGSRQVMRRYNPTDRARGTLMDRTDLPASDVQPLEGPRYKGPVVVLSGPATYSAAEDFLVAWKNSGRGKIVGEPTGGSTGQPLSFQLPGGGNARVCTKRDTFPDGAEWVGKGIAPDILARPTMADIRASRDAALERALQFLKTGN